VTSIGIAGYPNTSKSHEKEGGGFSRIVPQELQKLGKRGQNQPGGGKAG